MTDSMALSRTLLFALFNALTAAYEQGQEILADNALYAMCLAATTPFVAPEERDHYAQRLHRRLVADYEAGGLTAVEGGDYLDGLLEAVEVLVPVGVPLDAAKPGYDGPGGRGIPDGVDTI